MPPESTRRDVRSNQRFDLWIRSQVEQPPEPARLDEWIMSSRERWRGLTEPLPERVGPRLPHGRFYVAYEIVGERRQIAPHNSPSYLEQALRDTPAGRRSGIRRGPEFSLTYSTALSSAGWEVIPKLR